MTDNAPADERCVIREAQVTDVQGLAPLYRAFIEQTVAKSPGVSMNPNLDAERVLERLVRRKHADVLVAEVNGSPVGFAYVEYREAIAPPHGWWAKLRERLTRDNAILPICLPKRGWLAHLYVVPEHRRQGIATGLVEASLDWLRRRGATAIELNVFGHNDPARTLYEKLGMSSLLVHYRMEL